MVIGKEEFFTDKETYIMGILNVTPDSFSDGGKFTSEDAYIKQVRKMIKEGAHIIDIGGESTRPGATYVSAEEELERVIPVVEAIKKRFDIPVSLDTYKAVVAREGLKAGVDLVNDITGLKGDTDMAAVIHEFEAPCCLMDPGTILPCSVDNVIKSLKQSLALAEAAGIPDSDIILDPGVGFGKSTEENLEIINRLDEFVKLEYPVLLGCSRKSVIGNTLDLPVNKRLTGTLATTAMAVIRGCAFVRVHDVKENAEMIKMMKAILADKG